MKRVGGYLPEAEPIKKLQLEKTREFEGDLPVEIIKQIISFGSLFLRNMDYLSSEYFETRCLVSKKWFVASNKAAAHFLNSNFDMEISANMIFLNEKRLKNFIKKFGVELESFIFNNFMWSCDIGLVEQSYTSEDIACLPNLTTIFYNRSEDKELESIAEKCKKIKNVLLKWNGDSVTISNSILSGFEKIESLGVRGVSSFNVKYMKAMAEKFSKLKYLSLSSHGKHYRNKLIKGKFPLLEELDLGGSGTDNAGLAEIKDSFSLLKKMSLSYCKVTNLNAISQSYPFLEVLNLEGCNVHLADIKNSYPLLQELHLSSFTANRELNNICNSFPLLTRLYFSSLKELDIEVILNFAKERPKNIDLTIYIEVNEVNKFDLNENGLNGQWNKKTENLFPHIKIVLIYYRNYTLSASFPNKYHYHKIPF